MERKEEYIDKLLHQLHNLEAMVSAIKREESVSFSFFREAFQSGQEVMKLLHELEMSQIEEMKHQMGKLLMFLSESENKNRPRRPSLLRWSSLLKRSNRKTPIAVN